MQTYWYVRSQDTTRLCDKQPTLIKLMINLSGRERDEQNITWEEEEAREEEEEGEEGEEEGEEEEDGFKCTCSQIWGRSSDSTWAWPLCLAKATHPLMIICLQETHNITAGGGCLLVNFDL